MARPGQKSEFEALCLNRKTGKTFRKEFFSFYLVSKFVRKCRYSKEITVLKIDDLYDRGYSFAE